ncbi:MAG: Bpu10I family restriction endonuclease [Deltaproteobacteria bacterium]|nr:Bpu10I family restriction endonuclease [Deltaproteobacteria bacterium]
MTLPPLPTPHGEKLAALAQNTKLPPQDEERVKQAQARYESWRRESLSTTTGTRYEVIQRLVHGLNEYKRAVDIDLIFDSDADWLYRQKGQTKLDNSIIEEFLPMLVTAVFGEELSGDILRLGPTTCFSSLRFESSIARASRGAGLSVRSKDQDFAISRPVYIMASHYPDFRDASTQQTQIAYIAAECKTNLDKTMFQEAAATAQDVKVAVPGAQYFLLCEWLDMTPISTSLTPIDEILILRKAKRLPSNVRKSFSTSAGRKRHREAFAAHLDNHPFAEDVFMRWIQHVERTVMADSLDTQKALSEGYF